MTTDTFAKNIGSQIVTKNTHRLLDVKNLHVDFQLTKGRATAISGVNLAINNGTTVALVGESGSGKSVTSQAILGILPSNGAIQAGEILFQATPDSPRINLAQLAPQSIAYRQIRGADISMIFQEPMVAMSPVHTIGDQIGEALRLHQQCNKQTARRRVIEVLGETGFHRPENMIDSYPFELSGGMRQRAIIAMAMVCQPKLLIADEPTTALDVTIQAQILSLMKNLQTDFGTAILLITHDMGVVANMADEVVVAYRGQVVESGTRDEIFLTPGHGYLKSLLKVVPELWQAESAPVKSGLTEVKPKSVDVTADENNILRTCSVTKQFALRNQKEGDAQFTAVNHLDLSLRRGECLGVVGESGCGKSTLMKMMIRAVQPTSGSIEFNFGDHWANVHTLDDQKLKTFRQRMQLVFQDPYSALNPRMTVEQILTEPMDIQSIASVSERRDRARELLSQVQLPAEALFRYPHSFSGGQRQRVSIARALALTPECLLLDEPVSALDVSVQAQVLDLLQDLQQQRGLSYLFIAHNLAVVRNISNRIAVMCRGRIVEMASAQALIENAQHPYTQSLILAAPTTDLSRPLDYSKMDEKLAQPEHWAKPYRLSSSEVGQFKQVSPEHWVRLSEQ